MYEHFSTAGVIAALGGAAAVAAGVELRAAQPSHVLGRCLLPREQMGSPRHIRDFSRRAASLV
jgi:hypothetical protein